MSFYDIPSEIRKLIRDNDFRWKNDQQSTMARFLSAYSVHDSYLRGFELRFWGSWELILNWDLMAQKSDSLRERRDAYLYIHFPNIAQLVATEHMIATDNVIYRATTQVVSMDERSKWLDFITASSLFPKQAGNFLLDEDLHGTVFTGSGDTHLSIFHAEPTYFLALDSDGIPFHLPNLTIEGLT